MGVKNLWDILDSCKKKLPLHHLQNKRVCIDLSCWIVQLQNSNKSQTCSRDKLHLRSLFHRLRALLAINCSLIFVTDGSIPAIKLATYRRRLNLDSEVIQNGTSSHKVSSLRRNTGSEFSCMVKEAKMLGMALGIPCLDAMEEAEAQCALLNSESLCDGCFSSDSDIFLFGARTVYRDICLGEGGYVVCYEMSDIETNLGFGRNSLITLALLLGGDYSGGVRGIGPEWACQAVKAVGENNILQQIASDGLLFAQKAKVSKKRNQVPKFSGKENCSENEIKINGDKYNLERDKQYLQVIEAYLKPKCHSANSDSVHRVLGQHPFQRSKLHQICVQLFQWPADKIDEYILPKVAERELRRFANLRHTSSHVGLRLALNEMPVKCPISEIIKHRRVQGVECFEVAWEQIDGLKTSIVPADLIESACPEKIAEFEERKAEAKKPKRKPREKKTIDKASMDEIDSKLQELLLEIEQQSNGTRKASSSSKESISEKQIDLTKPDSKCERYHDSVPTDIAVKKTEVIDLLSPSPCLRVRPVPKLVEPIKDVRRVEYINLSDSETDLSPDHANKVRDLKLFLANIRKDIP